MTKIIVSRFVSMVPTDNCIDPGSTKYNMKEKQKKVCKNYNCDFTEQETLLGGDFVV